MLHSKCNVSGRVADCTRAANGIKIHDRAVWVSNPDKGTVLRIPVTRYGTAGHARAAAPARCGGTGPWAIRSAAPRAGGATAAIAGPRLRGRRRSPRG
ncbi:hypothetical protein FNH09_41345 [Streptomyces adustus]|uniref:Uncharacterized protein n=1 Tax=Streptomyces adustus TaxID=1609272 RepID=A0A5N8VTR2_9ACTN|nr:hypothetical protein [Streptomyces adustus]